MTASLLLSGCVFGPAKRTPKENKVLTQILFVGNSQTYENGGIDFHLQKLVERTEFADNVVIESTTEGKFHLLSHLEDEEACEIIAHEKWDKVILQEYTRGPIHAPEEFAESGRLWKKKLTKINPKVDVVFFSLWGYKKKLKMAQQLEDKCKEVAEEIDGSYVPVGLFWESLRGKINLYNEDGAHPNRAGTFASACLFYEYLLNKDVRETTHLDKLIDVPLQIHLKELAHAYHKANP
jgi:hypothetical protein